MATITAKRLKDVPALARDGSNLNAVMESIREAVQTFRGYRGDRLDAALTLRDFSRATQLGMLGGGLLGVGVTGGSNPKPDAGEPEKDLTPPPTPTGLAVSSAISNIFIECDAPVYTQGHGHDRTVVYGAKWVNGNPEPTFSDAVVLCEFQGTVTAYGSDPATTWCIWIKWKSIDGVLSVDPAGGTNGVQTTTGQDVALLLEALTGEIEASQLHADLGSRIDLIDGNGVGSVNARILTETNNRITAVAEEATNRVNAMTAEARARVDQEQSSAEAMLRNILALDGATAQASTNLALAKSELTTDFQAGVFAEAALRVALDARLSTADTQALALIADESTARATAVSAEATQRGLLATQILGADGTSLTQGLIYTERTTRSTETQSLAQQITLLSAGAGEQFDWQTIWYFDSGIESWSGNGTPSASNGWLRPADQASGAYVNSPAGVAADGAKYGQVRLRIRKTGTPTFAGWLYWQGTLDSTWDSARRIALTEPTFDVNGIGLITVTPPWGSITLDKIRVDLSSAQTATDCFELDWVAVGRPSPGASSAQLLSEQTTRAAADSALASDITTLSAQVNNATNGLPATYAALIDEQTARADADTAEAAARTVLAARVTTAEGDIATTASNLTTEQTTRATADTTNADAITTLSSQVNDVSTGLPQTRADLITTQSTLASATAASAADIRSLRVQSQQIDETALRNVLTGQATRDEFTGTLALATQELRTDMVNGISAEATARLALAAVVATNQSTSAAAITDEQTARTTADTALSSRSTALEASVTSLTSDVATKATISYVDTAKADAISASAVSIATVQAQLDPGGSTYSSIATVQTTASAAVTASSANASSISTVQARLDSGDFAAVKVESSASASSVTGLLAQYTVKLDVGGKVSGYGIASTGPTGSGSTFSIRADRFYVAPPASGAGGATDDIIPFTVQATATTAANGTPIPAGVYINTAYIKNATITSAQICSVTADSITAGYMSAAIAMSAGAVYNGVNAYTLTRNETTGVTTASWNGNTPGTSGFGTGYYLGLGGGAAQFFVGSPSNHMLWDGSSLTVRGTIYATSGYVQGLEIRNGAGQIILNSGNTATQIFNSNVTLGVDGASGRLSLDGAGGGSVNGVIMPGYPISGANVTTYIASAAIGNAQIGGDIYSSNWNGSTTGWLLDRTGNLYANSGNFRGSINVGDFTGYGWPAAGGTGVHISSQGIAAGNYNGGGKFFLLATPAGGNAGIWTNIPAYLDDLQIATGKIGYEQVTVPRYYTAASYSASIGITVAVACDVLVIGTIQVPNSFYWQRLKQNGVDIQTEMCIGGSLPCFMQKVAVSAGTTTFTISNDDVTSARAGIYVLATMR